MTYKVNYELLFAILAVIATAHIATAAPAIFPAFSSPVSDDEGATRTFSALAIDSGGIIPSNVSVFKNGSLVQYNESVPSGNQVDYTSVAVAGVWLINFTACNVEGCDSYVWLWTVNDTTTPSVTSNTNSVRVKNGSVVTLNASITDAGSGVKNATVNVSAINNTQNIVALENQSGFWLASIIADKATNGAETLAVVAYDNAGNVNDTVNMTVWVDGVAPASITGLGNSTHDTSYIKWNWTNPSGDFNHTMLYLNGTHIANVSAEEYNATGLTADTEYTLSTRTVDAAGNVNATWVNHTARTVPLSDTTAPTVTITSPENKTYATTSVPLTVSSNEAIVEWRYMLNGAANVTFSPNTTITAAEGANNITVWANDSAGNWNSSTVNFTVNTPSAPSSGGGSSGSSGGGGGVVSSEPAANIEKYKRVDGSLIANTPVTFSINLPESPVSEIDVTGKENQNDVTLRVDALRGMAKDVTISPPGVPYRHLIITENSKRIKEAVIRFKVENSWLTDNGIDEVSMLHWNGKQWNTLETVEKNKDDAFTYFEAKTTSFSPFTIVGVKKPAEATVTVTVATTPAPTARPAETTVVTATPEVQTKMMPKGFEIALALAGFGAIYMFRRRIR